MLVKAGHKTHDNISNHVPGNHGLKDEVLGETEKEIDLDVFPIQNSSAGYCMCMSY